MAAIASLAPSNGQGSEDTVQVSSANGTGQEVAVGSTSVAAAEPTITGPRWIAESVAVAAEESATRLDQEMERASAARTTAESASRDLPTPLRQRLRLPCRFQRSKRLNRPAPRPQAPTRQLPLRSALGFAGCRDQQRRRLGSSGNLSKCGSRTRTHRAEGRVRIRSRGGGRFCL